jgi:phenylacetate-coenzyme A ligase PaaK-like adenylate-forming protein
MNNDINRFDGFIKEVEYAYENVPFYKKKLDDLGIKLDAIKAESFSEQLPLTEKKDYRKNFPMGVLAKGFSLNHPMLNKSQSSGTTGERLVTFEIGMNLLNRAIACTRSFPVISDVFLEKGRKICRYAAPNCSDVECANPHSTMDDRLLADGTLVLPVYHDLLTTSELLIDRAIEEIIAFKPDLYYVDPTHFAFLARQFKKRNIELPVAPVVTSYSAATAVSRRQISDAFANGNPIAEFLSSSEMGWLAMECPHGNLHLNEESYFFEFISLNLDMRGEPSLFELCITSIDQGALPHIRYKTGDIVSLGESQCDCQNNNRVIRMEGRTTHFVNQNGDFVLSPKQVDDLISDPEWLDLYQFEQKSELRFTLKAIVNECYQAGDERTVIDRLIKNLKSNSEIKIDIVDYISSERSGKFQSVKGLGLNE